MRPVFSFLILLLSLSLIHCNNERKESNDIRDIDQASIWFDYQVRADEDNDSVTVKLQYRYGENGESILVEEPAKVEVDGKAILPAESKYLGTYYEVQYPLTAFQGDHVISFTNLEKEKFKERFSFRTLDLLSEIPDTVQRGDIVFHIEGLDSLDKIRIVMTDTSYAGEGINRVERVKNGKLIIYESELFDLANGPIHLELIKEQEREVENGTLEGGRLSISYGLKREFILRD